MSWNHAGLASKTSNAARKQLLGHPDGGLSVCCLRLPGETPERDAFSGHPDTQAQTAGELVIQLVLDLLDTCNFAFTKQVWFLRGGKRVFNASAAGSQGRTLPASAAPGHHCVQGNQTITMHTYVHYSMPILFVTRRCSNRNLDQALHVQLVTLPRPTWWDWAEAALDSFNATLVPEADKLGRGWAAAFLWGLWLARPHLHQGARCEPKPSSLRSTRTDGRHVCSGTRRAVPLQRAPTSTGSNGNPLYACRGWRLAVPRSPCS